MRVAIITLCPFPVLFFWVLGAGTNHFGLMFSLSLIFVIPIIISISSLRNEKIAYNNFISETNSIVAELSAFHLQGLPNTGNEKCAVCIRTDEVLIKTPRNDFIITYSKIFSAILSTRVELATNVQMTAKGNSIQATTSNYPAITGIYLTINYKQDDDTISNLIFEGNISKNKFKEIEMQINSRVRINNSSNNTTIQL